MMTSETYLVAKPEVIDCDIGGDRALLHIGTNTYFTVNETASEIWIALAEPRTVDQLVDVVTEKFDVAAAECRADVEALVAAMRDADIIGPAADAS
jgi:frataxin-like iron-binding protein CyaY